MEGSRSSQIHGLTGSRIKSNKGFYSQRRQKPKADEARELLCNLVFSHVPVVHFNFQHKVYFLGLSHIAYTKHKTLLP